METTMTNLTDAKKLRLLMDATSEKLALTNIKLAALTPAQWSELIDDHWLAFLGISSDEQLRREPDDAALTQLYKLADDFIVQNPSDALRLIEGFINVAGENQPRPALSIRSCLLIIILFQGVEFDCQYRDEEFEFRLGYKNTDEVKTAILNTVEKVLSAPGVIKEWMDESKKSDKKEKDD